MKEREQVTVIFQNGDKYNHPDAEVTRSGDVLIVRGFGGAVDTINWDFVAMYNAAPVGMKNLDEE